MTVWCWLALGAAGLLWSRPSRTERRLRAMADRARPPSVGRFWAAWPATVTPRLAVGAAVAVGTAVGATAGVALGLTVAFAAGVLGVGVVRSVRRCQADAWDAAIIAAVRLLRAELDAGTPLTAALDAAAQAGGAADAVFARAAQEVAHGAEPEWRPEATHGPPGHLAMGALVAGWRVAQRAGTPLADVLRSVEADLSARRAQARDVSVAVAGARSSATLVAGLPVVGLLLGTAMGARPLPLLLGSGGGHALLAVGVALDVLGMFWTSRIVDQAQRR